MNRTPLTTLIGALVLTVTLPAWAGPDFQAIEQARKNKHAPTARLVPISTPTTVDKKDCPPDRLVLLLDHGPRAQSTPYLNQQRKARYEAQLKACQEVAK